MNLIPEFTEGSDDTPLQASRMNEIVRLLNALRNLTVKPDGSGKMVWGEGNAVLELVASVAPASTSSASVKMFKIQTSGDHDDYVTCKEWTGSAETGDAVNVAKPFNLRIAQKPTGTHTTERPYTSGEIILAVEPTGGTGVTDVTLEDLNVDARLWSGVWPVKACKIETGGVYDDYLVVKEWDGTAVTGSAFNIAKPRLLRIAARPNTAHVITPAYAAGDLTYAYEPTGGTGVTVSSVAVTWQELMDARGWGYEINFCEVISGTRTARKAHFITGVVTNV